MKKMTVVMMMVSTLALMAFTGCSSSNKATESTDTVAASAAKTTAPVDLGASSAGRGI